MQNFTLGKKGISMLLFGLVLLTTSFSSFGQENCPTVSDPAQEFCYLATVSDLVATPNGDTVRWYRTGTSTNPIPNDELLQDGNYFAGNQSKTCTTRTAVSVTVDDFGAPEPLFGAIFSPCVYGAEPAPGDPDPVYIKTVQDLIANIEGNNVEIFDQEFDAVKLNETTALVRGENYFAGQRNPSTGCTTSRVAIRYDPIYSPAPAADPIQIVCEGATVADLQASATTNPTSLSQGFRWYSTMNSQPALANSTVLIDGEDYYVSQIVNRIGRDEPPCESTDRIMVTVQFDDINAGEPNSETYCKSEFDVQLAVSSSTPDRTRFEELFLQLLDAGVPQDGTFDPTPTDLGTAPQTYITNYTVISSLGCEDSVELTIIVTEDPTTGGNISEQVCRNTLPETVTSAQVEGFFRGLIATAGGEAGGTFANDDMATIASDFNSNTIYPTTFTSEYTIREGTACEATSVVSIEILESPNAGADNSETYCVAEIQDEINNTNGRTFEDLFVDLLEFGEDPDGSFDTTPVYAGPDTYTYNYTIELTNGCTDSATITVVINDPSAGEPSLNELCRAELPETVTAAQVRGYFASLLSDGATEGGSFSNIDAITAGFNSNDTYPVTYTSTYTVSSGTDCEDTADLSVKIYEAPNAGPDITDSICITELVTLVNPSDPDATILALLDRFGWDGDMTGTFTPSSNDLGSTLLAYYNDPNRPSSLLLTATYTVASTNTVCADDVAQFAITINDVQDANAGTIEDQEVCSNEGVIDLRDYLVGSGATPGGTFLVAGVPSDGMFDTSIGSKDGGYLITYQVDDSAECTTDNTNDSEDFILTVNDSLDSTAPINRTFCISDIDPNISETGVINYFNSLVASFPAGTFSTSPSDIYVDFKENPINTFTTTYTVSGDCGGSVDISVTVNDVEDAEAGTIADQEVCSNEGIIDLTTYLTDPNTTPGGIFSGDGVLSDGMFDTSIGFIEGGYLITYSVDGTASCVTAGTSDSETFTITVFDSPNAGADLTPSFCTAEIDNFIANPSEALNFFDDFITEQGDEVSTGGTFNRSFADVLAYYTAGDFTSPFLATYTVANADCTDTAEIAITITPVQQAEVDPIADFSVCSSEDSLNLFTYLNVSGGTFSYGSVEIENGLIDVSTLGDLPEITYSVNEDIDTTDCIEGSDSTTFTIEVVQGANAGAPNSVSLCNTQVNGLFGTNSVNTVRAYYIGLLESDEIDVNGTFFPTIQTLISSYNQNNFQDFTTSYTVSVGDCEDSVDLNITILRPEDKPVADAEQLFCSADNPTVGDLVVTGNNITWFEDAALTIASTNTDSLVNGDYYAVSISEDENTCNSFATKVIVSVVDNAPAPVAEANQDFCSAGSKTVGDLVITGDNITVYEDAELTMIANNDDALVDGEDYYAISFCGTESTMITVTVGETPDAPVADAEQSFCLVDNNTVADLVASGDNIVWYEDEDLTTVAPATTPLENGDVYYAVATGDDTCGSPSTMVTVTMNDPDAPTLQLEGNEFCRSDNPTLQDLLDNINGSGIQIYASLTGGTPLASTTALQNDVQYFATATDATSGCESSERLAIRVEVAFCGIPEGFSPNGDNINDRFVIPDIAINYPNYNIEIYNRWGNMVFKGNASTPDWDGISNQSGTIGDGVLPVGVYFYILNYNDGATASEQGKLYLSI
jgi:gliding motility-associated-like protein